MEASPSNEREWCHANGYKQNQVKGTSRKMGFNGRVELFFHFTFSRFKSEFFSIAGFGRRGALFTQEHNSMERLFSKDTEKLFACNWLKLEAHASWRMGCQCHILLCSG